MESDRHGQPFSSRFNRARRAERDLSEFLGLAKGLLADGVITVEEAHLVAQWIALHPDATEQWPLNILEQRLTRIYAVGRVDDGERAELAEILSSVVGGTAGIILGEDAATDLPIDTPPPDFIWQNSVFVFTGKFAFGTRADCQRHVAAYRGSGRHPIIVGEDHWSTCVQRADYGR